ncbi:MAG TPA: YciI family protein [Chthoniobacterales bacterium]|nr:YciI family protein [Chthoniobacterales bacterium]
MKTFYFFSFALLLVLLAPVERSAATDPIRPRQFIYVLHLVSRLHDNKAWTEEDKAAVERHFNRLKEAVKSGQVILAGRTQDTGDKTFGIAIFEAADENSARDFMNADPAVIAGVMTAELHPFAVALERKNP